VSFCANYRATICKFFFLFLKFNQTRGFFTIFREEVNLKTLGGPEISHQILLTSKQFTKKLPWHSRLDASKA
jgi:hypothetical protein